MQSRVARLLMTPQTPTILSTASGFTSTTSLVIPIPRNPGKLNVIIICSDAGIPTSLTGYNSLQGSTSIRLIWKILAGNEAATLTSTITGATATSYFSWVFDNAHTLVTPAGTFARNLSQSQQFAPSLPLARGGGNALFIQGLWSSSVVTPADFTVTPNGLSGRNWFYGGSQRFYGGAEVTGLSTFPQGEFTLTGAVATGVPFTIGIRGQ